MLSLFSFACAQEATMMRDWTSKQGTVIRGKALWLRDNTVQLERDNGSVINIPLALLQGTDEQILRDHFRTQPKATVPNVNNSSDSELFVDQKDINGSTIKIPYKLGSTNTVEAERDFFIKIYTPSTLRAGEKYGVILFVEPNRGSHDKMSSFINAAETNEMIIVTLPKKEGRKNWNRNNNTNNTRNQARIDEEHLAGYVHDSIDKLHRDFPIDSKRVYVAGLGDTAYVALWAMKEIGAAGFLAINGGGKSLNTVSNSEAILAMCATASKNRWDLATTYEQSYSSSIAHMMFYAGSGFPDKGDLSDAILMLNGIFLLKHQAGTHEQPAVRYEEQLMQRINRASGEKAIPWINFTRRYGLKNPENTAKINDYYTLAMKDPTAMKSIGGHETCVKTLLRYYDKGWREYKDDTPKRSVENAIQTIAMEYEGTMWHTFLTQLSKTHTDTNRKK